MKNAVNQTETPQIELICERGVSERQYRLYCVKTVDALFYIISISDSCFCSAETFFATFEEIDGLFDAISEGALSCDHLTDVAEDYKHAIIC